MAIKTAAKTKTTSEPRVRWYRNLGGMHAEGSGENIKYYKKGDKVPSTVDLVKKYANHFERCDPPEDEIDDDADIGGEAVITGEDVTELFPNAEMHDLIVFKDRKNYLIVAKDKPNKPLNQTPLATRAEVIEFIKDIGQ